MRIPSFTWARGDSDEARRKKQAIFVVASACCIAGCAWSAMYWLIFGWGVTTALPLSFVVIVGAALLVSHRTRNPTYTVYAHIGGIITITALIQWSIGGVFDSGFVMAWAFIGPVCALVFFPLRRALLWLALYLVNIAITVAFDDTLRRQHLPVPDSVRNLFFVMNLGVASVVVFVFASHFVLDARKERARADALQSSLDSNEAKRLGPYTLEEKLGQGGMGVVYRARHALLRRSTAIKLLAPSEDSTQLDRFEREVRLTSELSHPNIVAIYDYGRSEEGEFYYAMEHVPGTDLESLVSDYGPLKPARVVPILMQIADALEAAHGHGLVHRDIKPANIMLSRFDHRTDVVKVLDFGLVKQLRQLDGPALTEKNIVWGTPGFLSPESLISPDDVGPAGDIYALGAVGYFLLVGRPVFDGRTVPELHGHHIHTPPKAPSQDSKSSIPAALDEAILRCLAKSPAERLSAAALQEALRQIPLPGSWTPTRARTWWEEFEAKRERTRLMQRPTEPNRATVKVPMRDA